MLCIPIKSLFGTFLVLAIVENNAGVFAFSLIKCQGMDVTLPDIHFNSIKPCAGKLGLSSPTQINKDKIACFAKCVIEKHGLIDEEGQPHKENIDNLIDATMPEPVRADIKARWEKCMEEHVSKIDPKEGNCMSYAALAKCGHEGVSEICKAGKD